ncbi:MAG TPA: hypothetical protein VIC87_12050, partial [Vicinamibacteria bacterium]
PRPLRMAVFVLWTAGVPLLAAGFSLDRPFSFGAGASVLCVAVVLNAAAAVVVLVRSARRVA